MENIFFALIIALCFYYMFWVYISNADIKIEKIESYLKRKKLSYVRHRLVKKPNNPDFEIGENILTWIYFRKHHYEIDATDLEGNALIVKALYYQSVTFFRKNRVYFDIKEL